MEDARLRLEAEGIGGPAEQSPEIHFTARCVAQDRDGAVGRGPVSRSQVDQFAGAVERPAETRGARLGFNVTFHFARQSLGASVRILLLRTTHGLVCFQKKQSKNNKN